MNRIGMNSGIFLLLLLLFILICPSANAQTFNTINPSASPGAFDMSSSPQWARDLRRGSIVAFGTFPFTFFFTGFVMDTSRFISNGFDSRYAPPPFKSAGAPDTPRNQQIMRIGIAAAGSLVISLIDYFIVRNNRNYQGDDIRIIEPSPPLIIHTQDVLLDCWDLPLLELFPEEQPVEEDDDLSQDSQTSEEPFESDAP